jgi:hypothetical protein
MKKKSLSNRIIFDLMKTQTKKHEKNAKNLFPK